MGTGAHTGGCPVIQGNFAGARSDSIEVVVLEADFGGMDNTSEHSELLKRKNVAGLGLPSRF